MEAKRDKIVQSLEGDERTGAMIIRDSLKAPIYQIAENAGVNASVVADTVQKSEEVNFGYNAQKDEYGDMFKAGIIDPVKVIRMAVKNAAGIAGIFLTTEAVVVDMSEEARKSPKEYI